MFLTTAALANEPMCTDHVGHSESKERLEINTDVPSHLKGAVIIVRRADGKETVVPAEKFKVVPRKQQFIVTKVETNNIKLCISNELLKNRASLLAGYGSKNGLSTSTEGNNTVVETSTGVVGGVQYQRMLNDRLSIGAQGQTNKTGSLLLGLDF